MSNVVLPHKVTITGSVLKPSTLTGIGSGYWDQGRQEINKTVAWFKESDIFF